MPEVFRTGDIGWRKVAASGSERDQRRSIDKTISETGTNPKTEMIDHRAVSTTDAPQNDNPYSQGIVAGELLFVSGQGPTDPETMERVGGGIGTQTERTLENVAAIVRSAGVTLDDVVRVTVYLDDMDDYEVMNEAYGTFFEGIPPARVCVEVARLPGDISIEIDAIALLQS